MYSRPVKTVLQLQLVAFALTVSPAIHLGVLILLRSTGALPTDGFLPMKDAMGTFFLVVLGVGALYSAWYTLRLRKGLEIVFLAKSNTFTNRMRVIIITLVACEMPSITGLLIGLLSGDLIIASVAIAVSVAACIYHFPTRAWIEQAEDMAPGP